MTQNLYRGFPIPSFRERVVQASGFMVRDPLLGPELLLKFARRKLLEHRHVRRVDEYGKFRVQTAVAIASVVDKPQSEVVEVLNERSFKDLQQELETRRVQLGLRNRSFSGFGELCYVICRLQQPETVVETGVAFGWTSAYIQQALQVNGKGTLCSVDLPPFRSDHEQVVGAIVPERLREGWRLLRGSQRRHLPGLLKELGKVDFVHYDSDKTYHGMKWAFDTLWPYMSDDGVLVCDDLWNDAFLEFSEQIGRTPFVLEAIRGRGRLGLLSKHRSD